MNIICISGSYRKASANDKLLNALRHISPANTFTYYKQLHQLPLFTAYIEHSPSQEVVNWKKMLRQSDAVIISTPEYLHSIPALLKNALEWTTTSGELAHKKVLPITFTPHPPRGEKAMIALLNVLQALKASIITQLPLFQNELLFDANGALVESDSRFLLQEAIKLLQGGE